MADAYRSIATRTDTGFAPANLQRAITYRDQGDGTVAEVVSVSGMEIPTHTKMEMGYTGSDLTSVVYKNGPTTVATLTLVYDGSHLLQSVTRS